MSIKQKDIKILWGRSGNRCAICKTELTQDATAVSSTFTLGEQAHIVGDKETAARGNSPLSDEERVSYHNLILLCPTHHTEIDSNEADYPVERLYLIKSQHELWVTETLSETIDHVKIAKQATIASIIDSAVTLCDLNNWQNWTSFALSPDPRWSKDRPDKIYMTPICLDKLGSYRMQTPFIKRWVSPFYLRILHGNYASRIVVGDEREQFNADVQTALASITPEIASKLIRGYWREAITGSWFAGLKKFDECHEQIADLLLESKTCFAGQSHAFAMACYADDASVEYLTRYLNTYLRRIDCYYDQNWAMPALMWIDQIHSTNHAGDFLAPDGLWHHFTADKVSDDNDAWTIDSCKCHFWDTMQYCREHFID